jgi:hypothetical protein
MANELNATGHVPGNYNGKLFLRLPTAATIADYQLVNELNAISIAIKNQVPPTGFTVWEFDDLSNALEAVIMVQNKQVSFQLLGENEIRFIEQQF